MTCQTGRYLPPNRTIEEIEITDQVENLVPDKFVREPKFGVHNLLVIKENQIVKATSSGQTHPFKHLYVLKKAESPRWSDLVSKGFSALQCEIKSLLPNGERVVQKKVDGKNL